ncbi:hypothetical protein LI177_10185 [bacterium 210820-DFI.6.37]|nr:hypothetical protein [bacterium 210820-DFI.6.37]
MSRKNSASSPLSLIMNHLHITSVELACAIHVDPSLISRWRSKQRPFNSSSVHYENVLNYILEKDTRLQYQNIALLLMDHIPDIKIHDRDSAYQALDLWMLGNYHEPVVSAPLTDLSNLAVADVGIIKGTKQKKDSLLYLLDSALNLPSKKKLYLLFDDSTDSLLEQRSFYELWIQRLREVVEMGHEVYYIYNSSTFYSNIINLDNFLYLLQFSNYHVFYVRKNSIPYFDLYVLENVFALTSFSTASDNRKNILCSFAHPEIVKQMQNQCESVLLHCECPFDHHEKKIEQIAPILNGLQYSTHKIYIYTTSPFAFPIRPAEFRKILEYNSLSEEALQKALEQYENFIYKPLMKQNNSECHFLFNINTLSEVLEKPTHILFPKLLSEQELVLPKQYYSIYLEEILEYLSSPQDSDFSFPISVTSNVYHNLPGNILVYSVGDLCTYICSEVFRHRENHLFFTNPLFTNEIYDYLEQMDLSLPEESRNNRHLRLLIQQFLQDLAL